MVVLGGLALSILDLGAVSPPTGPGGALGWGLRRLLAGSGLGAAALPISMAAAALVGLLRLATTGLCLRDWREIGEGAGRGAPRPGALSGGGPSAATWILLGGVRRWRQKRLARHAVRDGASRGTQPRPSGGLIAVTHRPEPLPPPPDTGATNGRRQRGVV